MKTFAEDSEYSEDFMALSVIDSNYSISRGGIIQPKVKGYQGTAKENHAIDYLCSEWDYGFED